MVSERNKKASLSHGCIKSQRTGSIHSTIPVEMYSATDLCRSFAWLLLKTRARRASAEYHNPLSFNVLAWHYTTFSQSLQPTDIWCLILQNILFIRRFAPYLCETLDC